MREGRGCLGWALMWSSWGFFVLIIVWYIRCYTTIMFSLSVFTRAIYHTYLGGEFIHIPRVRARVFFSCSLSVGSFYFRRIGAGWYHGAGASLLLEAFLRGSFLFGTSVQISSMCCVGLLIDLLIVRAMRGRGGSSSIRRRGFFEDRSQKIDRGGGLYRANWVSDSWWTE